MAGADNRVVLCAACKAPMIFLCNPITGKQVPIDAANVLPDQRVYLRDKGHVSHFKTCTDPNRFSKSNK